MLLIRWIGGPFTSEDIFDTILIESADRQLQDTDAMWPCNKSFVVHFWVMVLK